MRTVVDHHVDRPGVEAQQCVQLTGTNRSIGLNALMTNALPRGGHRRITIKTSLLPLSFAGLVAVARSLNPIPSRTRPLNSSAPMVLCLKTWESRSLPGLPRTTLTILTTSINPKPRSPRGFVVYGVRLRTWIRTSHRWRGVEQPKAAGRKPEGCRKNSDRAPRRTQTSSSAGWSSPVARQAHNLKVVSSNLAPATNSPKAPHGTAGGAF